MRKPSQCSIPFPCPFLPPFLSLFFFFFFYLLSSLVKFSVAPSWVRTNLQRFSSIKMVSRILILDLLKRLKTITTSIGNSVELIIACKYSSPCHAKKHVCSDSSVECSETLKTDNLKNRMHSTAILQGLSRGQHHSPPQSVKGIGTDPGNCCYAPTQQETSKEITLQNCIQNKPTACNMYIKYLRLINKWN